MAGNGSKSDAGFGSFLTSLKISSLGTALADFAHFGKRRGMGGWSCFRLGEELSLSIFVVSIYTD